MSIIGQIEAVINQQPWADAAICSSVDPELFHPPKGASNIEAKRICGMCTVRQECLDYAITHNEIRGIWGGLSAGERHRLGRSA